jgi:uracil-DNA glycosylase family 4
MDERLRRQYLQTMGIDLWVVRRARGAPALFAPRWRTSGSGAAEAAVETVVHAPEHSVEQPETGHQREDLEWETLRERVAMCTACSLHATRTQSVFGVGNRAARWMVVGEAPGADEDRQGEPFVGRAGQLLNAMLMAVGLRRDEVYIANILKCRPPGNRDPLAGEAACCEGFLERQIALVQPRLILCLGRIAAQNLLKTDASLAALRGHPHRYGETQIPVVVTYHPAYLLRSQLQKRKTWEDLKLARNLAGT